MSIFPGTDFPQKRNEKIFPLRSRASAWEAEAAGGGGGGNGKVVSAGTGKSLGRLRFRRLRIVKQKHSNFEAASNRHCDGINKNKITKVIKWRFPFEFGNRGVC